MPNIYLNQKGVPGKLENIQPTQNSVYSIGGEELPMDIKNKTIEELRSMGFKDMVSFEVKHDPVNGDTRPVLPPEEK